MKNYTCSIPKDSINCTKFKVKYNTILVCITQYKYVVCYKSSYADYTNIHILYYQYLEYITKIAVHLRYKTRMANNGIY